MERNRESEKEREIWSPIESCLHPTVSSEEDDKHSRVRKHVCVCVRMCVSRAYDSCLLHHLWQNYLSVVSWWYSSGGPCDSHFLFTSTWTRPWSSSGFFFPYVSAASLLLCQPHEEPVAGRLPPRLVGTPWQECVVPTPRSTMTPFLWRRRSKFPQGGNSYPWALPLWSSTI